MCGNAHKTNVRSGRLLRPREGKACKPSVATGCLLTGMTEASGKDSVGVPKGQMSVKAFIDMTADDRKVVR